MVWKYAPLLEDIEWVLVPTYEDGANINVGSSTDSDLLIDTGDRSVNGAEIDQGNRIIDGNT